MRETMENNSIKVLLADDHMVILRGISVSLASVGIDVVGQAKTHEELIQKYKELQPDVLLSDIQFGAAFSGFDAIREILKDYPAANIVFLSQFEQSTMILEGYDLGCRAYLSKDCTEEELVSAIKLASEGKQYFPPEMATKLASLAVNGDNSPQGCLDARELEFFVLLAQGFTINEIANKYNVTTKTVNNISTSIKTKLKVTRPAQLTLLAVKYRHIQP